MITISSLHELRDYGIINLTGEADALMFRILCDLTEQGMKIFCKTFGIVEQTGSFYKPVNYDENDPHVAQVMLPHDAWWLLAPIALLDHSDAREVWYAINEHGTPLTVIGFQPNERYIPGEYDYDTPVGQPPRLIARPQIERDGAITPWPSCYGKLTRRVAYPGSDCSQPRVSDRNVHAMSGTTLQHKQD